MADEPAKANDRGAVLQFEVDVGRFTRVAAADFSAEYVGETAWKRLFHIVATAARDTVRNGGTLVLVRDLKRDTITIVQRPDAEEFTE